MLFLALKQLFTQKKQSLLALLGIVLGTAAYVVISGIMLGFQLYIVDQLINNDAHVKISAKETYVTPESVEENLYSEHQIINWKVLPSGRRDNTSIYHPQGWFERLESHPAVMSYSPQIIAQVIARRGKSSVGASIIGVNPEKQMSVTNIKDYIIQGKFTDIGHTGNKIIVGDALLNKMGGAIGENILLSVGKGNPIPFKVVGIFHLGIKGIDDTLIYGALLDIQQLNSTPSQINSISIKLFDIELALPLATQWSETSIDKVESWEQANANFLSIFKMQDIVRNSMTISITVVACFGIYNILNMLVNQKKREIAILRSIGYETSDIRNLFVIQGIILGFIGGLAGLVIGFLICVYLSTMEAGTGLSAKGGTMLVSFEIMIYVKAFLLAFIASLIAGYLPARAASKMTPIEIIRNEAE
ncbi:MAG: ABC transporter permease [Leptospira sp.]|nr:ABC transporter permease [Leptospira sp.]